MLQFIGVIGAVFMRAAPFLGRMAERTGIFVQNKINLVQMAGAAGLGYYFNELNQDNADRRNTELLSHIDQQTLAIKKQTEAIQEQTAVMKPLLDGNPNDNILSRTMNIHSKGEGKSEPNKGSGVQPVNAIPQQLSPILRLDHSLNLTQ